MENDTIGKLVGAINTNNAIMQYDNMKLAHAVGAGAMKHAIIHSLENEGVPSWVIGLILDIPTPEMPE